jgi:membrane associated rhomboid family serine protease
MGIYDREYYRREGPSFLGAITSTGQVCKWLILVNVVVFIVQMLTRQTVVFREGGLLWQKTEPGWFTDAFLLDTQAVLHGEVWRLLTYAFLHSNVGDGGSSYIFHIVFNMLFLWWFGTDVEELYGKWEFLTFYLVSAFVGGVAFLAWGAASPDPTRCLGASGAVTAVMVLYALHFPRRLIYIWFVLPVPIWLFVVFQVAQDSFIFVTNTKSTTAVTVHLGGALFAFVYYKTHLRLLRLLPDLRAWQRQRRQPQLRVYREEEAPAPVSVGVPQSAPEVDEHLEAKVDALLEKMARYGKESLTDSERALLLRASELYRRRRT